MSTSPYRQDQSYSRPYRSRRQPPCNQCRSKKLRCEREGDETCVRCRKNGTPCSFGGLPRSNSGVGEASREAGEEAISNVANVTDAHPTPIFPVERDGTTHLPRESDTQPAVSLQIGGYTPPERPLAQVVQTLDQLDGFSTQLNGASGDADPWLLRHGRFDDHGFLMFHQVHFRNAGGLPLHEKIPTHFLVSADSLYAPAKARTRFCSNENVRHELNTLVPLECGRHLVALFDAFVFPSYPVISRTQLGLRGTQKIPTQETLSSIPVHLLAAIYASAQPFSKFDDYLCLFSAYSQPTTEKLWRIVLELVLEEINTPHLAVIQAGLLYLHRQADGAESAIAESPFPWSLVGLLVGCSTALGLQLECRPMGLPSWEKRLRRRLWWALYSEDKWRSLLYGRPPYIRADEWDVTDLDEADFHRDQPHLDLLLSPSHLDLSDGIQFRHFTRLSRIADEVQHALYSLRAAQRLSVNFPESLSTAHSLLRSLKEWYASLPPELKLQTKLFTPVDGTGPKAACLHHSYILLEIFIFRALLRPMVRSALPLPLLEEPESARSFSSVIDDYISQIIDAEEVEPVPGIDTSDGNDQSHAVIKAAENCAATMLRLVMRMTGVDFASFWYSWSRVGFATVSSFMMLLLVQAPTKEHAIRARRLLYMWRQVLRSQIQGSNLMNLGLVRLDGPHWAGLNRNFYLPPHVEDALEAVFDEQRA